MVGRGLGRQERVCKSFEYRLADSQGQRFSSDRLYLLVRPNDLDRRRLGMVVGRHVGAAVERNRLKRWIREAYRSDKERFPNGMDIVVVARGNRPFRDFADLRGELLAMAAGGRITARRASRKRSRDAQ